MAGNIVVSQINGGSIGVINAIINGNFQVNQRAVSGTVTLAAGVYGHDRWKAGASGCTYTFATANNITTLTISAGSLIQVIEGNNLFTGTYTLSWTGTAQGKIGGGSYASSGVTGTPAGGSNLNIEFNTGTLSLVQFEPGSVATPFERRLYGDELVLCQRYTQLNTAASGKGSIGGGAGAFYVPLPVQMRAAPTVTLFTGTNRVDQIYTSQRTVTAVNGTFGNDTAGTAISVELAVTSLGANSQCTVFGGTLLMSSEL